MKGVFRFLVLFLFFAFLLKTISFAGQNLKFKYLNSSDGLSNNYVTDILEDDNGFLWFSTSDGLNKWDGYTIEIFRHSHENPNSLPTNFILSLTGDFSTNIWIGTNQTGVVRYNQKEDKFYRYQSQLGIDNAVQSTYIRKILVDADSTVWIATDLGLSKYQPETDDFKRIKFGAGEDLEIIRDIYETTNRDVVFQTNVGVFIYSIESEKFSQFKIHGLDANELENSPLCFASNNILWIGSLNGLIRYDLHANVFQRFKHDKADETSLSSTNISCVFEDSQKNIWIGTRNAGVNLFNSGDNNFEIFKAGKFDGNHLSNNIVTRINEDNYHNVWIATQEGGLNYFNTNDNLFRYYKYEPNLKGSFTDSKISAFAQSQNGNIWLGTGNGGVSLYNEKQDDFTRYYIQSKTVSPSILGILPIDNQLYVTGWGIGLYSFDFEKKQFNEITVEEGSYPNKMPSTIKGMGRDEEGHIWIMSHSSEGIYVYDPKSKQLYNHLNSGPFDSEILSSPYAVTMMEDYKNRIWIVSYTGLYMYDGEFHRYRNSDKTTKVISSNYNYCIFQDMDSTLWVGNTNGLDKIIDNANGDIQFDSYTKRFQLPENIKAIEQDDNGNLWLSSNEGLVMFNPKTFEHRIFKINREVPGQEFFERSLLKSNNGELFFGTTNGFYRFAPDSIIQDSNEPHLYFTDFKIFNESQKANVEGSPLKLSIQQTNEIVLRYNQSVISFEYVALDLEKPGQIEYAYYMEGINRNWNFVGTKRFASYTNLDPGEYVFKVRTAEGKQLSEQNEISVKIIITPPFWLTTWAYVIYTVSLLVLLFLLQMAVLYRVKMKNDLRLEKLRIEDVQESNLMKLRFFTNISHEFRTPLTLIKAPIDKLINSDMDLNKKERKYHYELISNSTQKMLSMVNQLMDYRKLEAGSLVLEPSVGDLVAFCRSVWENYSYVANQRKIEYLFTTQIESFHLAFDKDKFDKVLSNLLSNAFKNTSDLGRIEVVLKQEKLQQEEEMNNIIISVQDSGIGITEKDLPYIFDRFYMVANKNTEGKQGTGIGLTLAKELVELHGGKIEVHSQINEGSTFVISLPIIADQVFQPTSEISNDEEFDSADESNNSLSKVLVSKNKNSVLVVEDDKELATFIEHELTEFYKVIIASNGEEGFNKVMSEKPDLVLSDVMMPVMDGIELCKKLKSDTHTSHIPVVLLTARYSQEKELEGFESGADAYVLKPFNLKILLSRISNLLTIRKELFEKFEKGTSLFFDNDGIESRDQKLIQDIIDLIVENITNDKINANFIADKIHMSRSLVYVKIEALTGQTVNEFIRNIRLKKSIYLLKSTELTITEIAFAVGFSSQSYFSRSFAKQFGCSPKVYLQQLL